MENPTDIPRGLEILVNIEKKKFCAACSSMIDVSGFGKQKSSWDGLKASCKECERLGRNKKLKIKKELGQCARATCTNGALSNSPLCEEHYLEGYATKYLKKVHKREGVRILREKFKRYGGKCPYTGEKLTLALNAHLDHIIPISRVEEFGIDPYDPENVEWISKRANISKSDMTRDEFILFCAMIAKNFSML